MTKTLIKLNPAPTIEAPVSLTIPGQAEPVAARLQFRYLNRNDLQTWLGKPDAEGKGLATADWLAEVVVGWNAEDVDFEFTPENFRAFLTNYLTAGTEIYHGYLKALTESRAKN